MEKGKYTELRRKKRYLLKIILILLGYCRLIWFSHAGIFRQGGWGPQRSGIQSVPTADSPDYQEQLRNKDEV